MKTSTSRTRKIAILLACLLLAMAAAGCAGESSPSADSNVPAADPGTDNTAGGGGTTQDPAPATGSTITLSGYEFNTEPVTLTAVVDWPQSFGNWGDDSVTRWITDTVGVTIDITWATTTTGEELNLLLAGGEQLPDFIVTGGGGATAQTLFREQYVAALDELAAQYFPGFTDLLPDKMYEAFQEDDGHLYRTADWFADYDKMMQMRDEGFYVTDGGNQQFLLNRPIYEELGSPSVNTLDEFRAYLNAAKEAHPEIGYPLMMANVAWGDGQDTVNFIYRLFGGQDWLYPNAAGSIELCLRDPRYKSALQYLNGLYNDGLIKDDNFAMAQETFDSTLAGSNLIAFSGSDFNWFGKVPGGETLDGPCLPIMPPNDVSINREDIKLKSLLSGVGGGTATFISADAVNAARAIEYIAFRYTDEAQTAERYGIQGEAWEYDTDGKQIVWTQAYNDIVATDGWLEMSKLYGCNNGTHSWFITNAICKLESGKADYPVRALSQSDAVNQTFCQNERIFDLTKVIKNDDIQMKYEQLMMLVEESVVSCIRAGSESDFNAAYDSFVSTAESLGLADIEAYFTESYQKWESLGMGG
ncbi:MAG: hypothetical protein LBR76_02115 [Oscillospiraceae bacterium]|nr:hypothetical protein [Oscillospiraceae bacterium]